MQNANDAINLQFPDDFLPLLRSGPLDQILTPLAFERLKVIALQRERHQLQEESYANALSGQNGQGTEESLG